MDEKIMINVLTMLNQSWDKKVKAEGISEWDKAGWQKVRSNSSSNSLFLSAYWETLEMFWEQEAAQHFLPTLHLHDVQ